MQVCVYDMCGVCIFLIDVWILFTYSECIIKLIDVKYFPHFWFWTWISFYWSFSSNIIKNFMGEAFRFCILPRKIFLIIEICNYFKSIIQMEITAFCLLTELVWQGNWDWSIYLLKFYPFKSNRVSSYFNSTVCFKIFIEYNSAWLLVVYFKSL